MEYTEGKISNLTLRKNNKERIDKKFLRIIDEHKWIRMIVVSLIILSSVNIIMIYNFFKILQNIWIYEKRSIICSKKGTKNMSIKYNVMIQKEEWYVAKCLDNNVASQGKTIDESIKKFKRNFRIIFIDIELEEFLKHLKS